MAVTATGCLQFKPENLAPSSFLGFLMTFVFGPQPKKYMLGGNVTGVAYPGLQLQNGGEVLPVNANGSFVFDTKYQAGTGYNVTVASFPSGGGGGQLCTLGGATGTMGAGDQLTLSATCADADIIQAKVIGLAGTGLVLLNNGADPLAVSGNGDVAFFTPLIIGQSYSVSVGVDPINPSQVCQVSNGTGTITVTPTPPPTIITGPIVDCFYRRLSINVNVTGLLPSNSITLQSSVPGGYPAEGPYGSQTGTESLTIYSPANSGTFLNPIRSLDPYNVSIATQPAGQNCTLSSTTGTMPGTNTPLTLNVNCSANAYPVGGTVNVTGGGSLGSGLSIQMGGSSPQIINVTGTNWSSSAIPFGSSYSLKITNPTNPWQTCAFTNAGTSGGTIGSSGALDANGAPFQDQISGATLSTVGGETSIVITCTLDYFTIGGTVTGLPSGLSQNLILRLNGNSGSDVTVSANGTFNFGPMYAVASGLSYAVTVAGPPIDGSGHGLNCSVSSPGTVAGSNITSVVVSCVPAPLIKVSVTGVGLSPFTLDPDGAGSVPGQTVNADGSYYFFVSSGTSYDFGAIVPTNQTCTWSPAGGNSGTMGPVDIALGLDCSPMVVATTVNADAGVLNYAASGTGPFTIRFNKNIQSTILFNSPGSTDCASQSVQISMITPVNNNFISCVPISSYTVSGTDLTVTLNQTYMWYGATYKIRIKNSSVKDSANVPMAYAVSAAPCDTTGCYNSSMGFNTAYLLRQYDFAGGGLTDSSPGAVSISGGSGTPVTGVDGDGSGAYSFNGGQSFVAPDTNLPVGGGARTMCTWVNLAAQPGGAYSILSYGAAPSNLSELAYWRNGSNYEFEMTSGNGNDAFVNVMLPIKSWTHLCAVYAGGTQVYLYVNGVKVASPNFSSTPNTTSNGTLNIGSRGGSNYHNGGIDGVRIYGAALPDRQIRYLATQVPNGLVAHYDLNGDKADSSGFDRDLTSGSATVSADRFGLNGGAYLFNGTSDYLSGSDAGLPAGTSPRTLCAWYNLSSGTSGMIGAYGTPATGQAFGLQALPTTYYLVFSLGGNPADLAFYQKPIINVWRHICGVVDSSSKFNIYLDGNLIAGPTAKTFSTVLGSISIGRFNGSYDSGYIDDVRVYNRALTLAEVQALVQQPNKRIVLSLTAVDGSMTDVGGTPGTGANPILKADSWCPAGYKAMIVDGVNRQACNDGNSCQDNGILDNIDWVLRPNVTYVRSDRITPIFTAIWGGVWSFDNGNFANTISTSVSYPVWTGLRYDWSTDNSSPKNLCSNWISGDSLGGDAGTGGYSGAVNSGATNAPAIDDCGAHNYLYCVEQ